ncbi:MAG: hypothetical protein M0Z63_10130 [Actinomycetota bacterium]|nr:hypothetical protein [Actinomycetota bacterium]
MTAPDRTRRAAGSRPGSYPGSRHPKEAPRPERPSSSSSPERSAIHLCPATFVELSGDQERHAIEALAELLVPLLTSPLREPADPVADPVMAVDVAPIGDT